MARKDLRSVQTNLAALAGTLPTQHVAHPELVPALTASNTLPHLPSSNIPEEEIIQFSLSLRKSLRKELARLADEADMTMRAFVLLALRDKGLSVTNDDLLDLRKERSKGKVRT